MYGNNDYRDYLQHARPHKYILKIGKGITARYFYTQEEIRAFREKAGRKAKNAAIDAGAALYDKTKAGKLHSDEEHRRMGIKPLTKKQKAYGLVENARVEAISTKDTAKRNAKKAVKRYKRIAKGAAKKYGPEVTKSVERHRKRLAEDVKGDIANTRKSVSKSANKAKKGVEEKWNTSEPAKALRRVKYKRRIEKENKIAVKTRPDRIRRPNNVGGVRPSRAGIVKGSVMFDNPDISHPTVAREYEKRDQLARKAETRKADQAYQKKNQKRIAKESKRKARRKKVKRVINSVLRRG